MLFPPTLILDALQYFLMNAKIAAIGHGHTSWEEKVALQKRGIERGGKFPKEYTDELDILERVTPENYPRIYNLAKEIAYAANQPMPALYMYDGAGKSCSPGLSDWHNYSILLSRQFCNELTDDELTSLIGHEFSHFFDNRMIKIPSRIISCAVVMPVKSVLASATLGTFKILSDNDFDFSKLSIGETADATRAIFLTGIVFGFVATLLEAKESQKHEYQADALGAHVSEKKAAQTVPNKSKTFAKRHDPDAQRHYPDSDREVNPINEILFRIAERLISSHPPTEKRKEAIAEGKYTDAALARTGLESLRAARE